MGRLFFIVHAMISHLLWNICSWPRSEFKAWLIQNDCLCISKALATRSPPGMDRNDKHLWHHLQTHGHWSLPVAGRPYSRYLDIQDCAAAATKETTPLYCIGDTPGGQKPALLLCPPSPVGCRAGLPHTLILEVTTFKFASLAEELWASFGCHTQCLQLVI